MNAAVGARDSEPTSCHVDGFIEADRNVGIACDASCTVGGYGVGDKRRSVSRAIIGLAGRDVAQTEVDIILIGVGAVGTTRDALGAHIRIFETSARAFGVRCNSVALITNRVND